MLRRTFIAASASTLAMSAIPATGAEQADAASTLSRSGLLPVNGLDMYHEVHGEGGVPLLLLHGAFSAIGTSFGTLLPILAQHRQVIALEMQGHGRTADIDRAMSYDTMAVDVEHALAALDVPRVDVLGYSMGAGIGLRLLLARPDLVRSFVHISSAYSADGIQPGLMEGLGQMTPSMMYGSTFHEEYVALAPRPHDFDTLFQKKTAMDLEATDLTDVQIGSIRAPVLVVAGDSDFPTVEHMTAFYRLLGGGHFGDGPEGLPLSQLAILPGTSHIGMTGQSGLLAPIVNSFLNRNEA